MARRVLIVVVASAALLAAVVAVVDGGGRVRPSPHGARVVLPPWARQMLARAPLFPARRPLHGTATATPPGSDPYRRVHGYTCFVVPGGGAVATPCGRPARRRFIASG